MRGSGPWKEEENGSVMLEKTDLDDWLLGCIFDVEQQTAYLDVQLDGVRSEERLWHIIHEALGRPPECGTWQATSTMEITSQHSQQLKPSRIVIIPHVCTTYI
jgi:hypothetical protein